MIVVGPEDKELLRLLRTIHYCSAVITTSRKQQQSKASSRINRANNRNIIELQSGSAFVLAFIWSFLASSLQAVTLIVDLVYIVFGSLPCAVKAHTSAL